MKGHKKMKALKTFIYGDYMGTEGEQVKIDNPDVVKKLIAKKIIIDEKEKGVELGKKDNSR